MPRTVTQVIKRPLTTRIQPTSLEKIQQLAESKGLKVCTIASALLEKALAECEDLSDMQKAA